jgi:hypothetical protein
MGFLRRHGPRRQYFSDSRGPCFLLLGSLAKSHARELRPILAAFAVGYLALVVNSHEFFFQGQ